ncbi:MAG TPA: alpha/beta hydrolase [Nevskiaceae bacterium]|nr:alpha/beta hydrolase [Nevskiaceae bacterium]
MLDVAAAQAIGPPSCWLLLAETRALLAWPTFDLRSRCLTDLPHGDGHAVLVLPGFGANDYATAALRRAIARLGYTVSGWGCGVNLGLGHAKRGRLHQRLLALHANHGPVSLVGWSLGGVFARELARHDADKVRQVITLGSPFTGNPTANNLQPVLRLLRGGKPLQIDWERVGRHAVPPPVPCTALHTRSDGIVNWHCCLEPPAVNTRNVEVHGSHSGLVFNTEVLRTIAQLLAQPLD